MFSVAAAPWHLLSSSVSLSPGWIWGLMHLSTLSYIYCPPGSFSEPVFSLSALESFSVFMQHFPCISESSFPFPRLIPIRLFLLSLYLSQLLVCVFSTSDCVCAQSCLALCNPRDSSLPGSSVHRILQARMLEWVAISSSRGSSRSRVWTCLLCYHWTTWEAHVVLVHLIGCVRSKFLSCPVNSLLIQRLGFLNSLF